MAFVDDLLIVDNSIIIVHLLSSMKAQAIIKYIVDTPAYYTIDRPSMQ